MSDYFNLRYGRRNPYFEALLREGTNTSAIGAPTQGMSRLAFALLSGLERNDLERREREAVVRAVSKGGQSDQQILSSALPLPGAPVVPLPRPRPLE